MSVRTESERHGESPSEQPRKKSAGTWIGYGVIGVFVTLCMVGWSVVMGNSGPSRSGINGISGRTITYEVQSDTSVRMTFQILKPEDARVSCTARAQAVDGLVVGEQKVVAEPGKGTSTQLIYLATSSKANTAELRDCERS
ncbi:DUF4307 domain-containing protein [Actinocorallia populi]|uniref:DUF4307 domain-containing protein n=1 Tax=Actinocorallia populi TaxID=2079200 RepID=UPI0013002D0E|nr:DUF4307 domain-containing protein [Actinocorallia populi]